MIVRGQIKEVTTGGGGGGGLSEQELYDVLNADFNPLSPVKSLFETLSGNKTPLANLLIDYTNNSIADTIRNILINAIDQNNGLSVFKDAAGNSVFIDSSGETLADDLENCLNKLISIDSNTFLINDTNAYLNSIDGTLLQSLVELQTIDTKLTSQATAALQNILNALVTSLNSKIQSGLYDIGGQAVLTDNVGNESVFKYLSTALGAKQSVLKNDLNESVFLNGVEKSVFIDSTTGESFTDSFNPKFDAMLVSLASIEGYTFILNAIDLKLAAIQADTALIKTSNAAIQTSNAAILVDTTAIKNQNILAATTATSFTAASLALLTTAIQVYLTANPTRTYISHSIGNNGANNATFNSVLITKT